MKRLAGQEESEVSTDPIIKKKSLILVSYLLKIHDPTCLRVQGKAHRLNT